MEEIFRFHAWGIQRVSKIHSLIISVQKERDFNTVLKVILNYQLSPNEKLKVKSTNKYGNVKVNIGMVYKVRIVIDVRR